MKCNIFKQNYRKVEPNINIDINGTDLMLMLLYAKGSKGIYNEPILTFTKLDRMLFLLNKEEAFMNLVDFEFDHENYGPFSAEAFDMMEALIISGIIMEKHTTIDLGTLGVIDEIAMDENCDGAMHYKCYPKRFLLLSDKGIKIAEQLWATLTDYQKTQLTKFKMQWNYHPLTVILHYIYQRYPIESGITESISNK